MSIDVSISYKNPIEQFTCEADDGRKLILELLARIDLGASAFIYDVSLTELVILTDAPVPLDGLTPSRPDINEPWRWEYHFTACDSSDLDAIRTQLQAYAIKWDEKKLSRAYAHKGGLRARLMELNELARTRLVTL